MSDISSTTFAERPGLRRICPAWAYGDSLNALADASRPVTVCDGDAAGAGEHLVIVQIGLTRRGYLVKGGLGGTINGEAATCLGTYDGEPVWRAGGMYLFHSVVRDAWVWRDELAEPICYTITEEDSQGAERTTRLGDSFYELASPPDSPGQAVECVAYGPGVVAGEEEEEEEAVAPTVAIGADVWACRSCGARGEGLYSPLYGSAEGDIQIGYGRWTIGVNEIVSGGDFEADGWYSDGRHVDWTGKIVWRDGAHDSLGRWEFVGVPTPGQDFSLVWVWNDGADPADYPDFSPPPVTAVWRGYAPGHRNDASSNLVYQASRLL
jgi:hypothetical protein